MAEYIKREAAMDIVKRTSGDYAAAWAEIGKLPAENVEPVKRGHWIDGNALCPICGKSKFDGLEADIWADWKPKCCPNCGAKMDGGAIDEVD